VNGAAALLGGEHHPQADTAWFIAALHPPHSAIAAEQRWRAVSVSCMTNRCIMNVHETESIAAHWKLSC
jgi:hypothetical protein